MEITVNQNQIDIRFPYKPELVQAVKDSIPGRRWNPQTKGWHALLNPESASATLRFAEKHGFVIIPKDQEKLKNLVAQANINIQASKATSTELTLIKPEGLNCYNYQEAGVAFAAQKKNVLIADEMGLGKTIQALMIVNQEPRTHSVLVICPSSVKINWYREAEKWLVSKLTMGIVHKGTDLLPKKNIVFISYDLVKKKHKEILARQWDFIIIDESHALKNPKTIRTKYILGYRGKTLKERVEKIGDENTRWIFLTGTPILNRPIELYPILRHCAPEQFKSMMAYAKRYCAAYHNNYGWDFSGSSNLAELGRKLRASFMVRRLKKDVLKELPPKIRQVITLPLEGAKPRKWVAESRKIIDRLFEETNLNTDFKPAFEELAKIRKESALSKVPTAVNFIANALENSQKVIVFGHHIEALKEIYENFKDRAVLYTGSVDSVVRQQYVDRFQSDTECGLFIGSIGAAGLGNTLTAASHVIFIEEPFRPSDVSQAEDRAHRIGQTESVLVQHLVYEGDLDHYMINMIMQKEKVSKETLDTIDKLEEKDYTIVSKKKKEGRATYAPRKKITEEQAQAVLQALRILAAKCDGAYQEDGQGFNKFDTKFGKNLAERKILSDKQAIEARELVLKYKRQYSNELYKAMWQ